MLSLKTNMKYDVLGAVSQTLTDLLIRKRTACTPSTEEYTTHSYYLLWSTDPFMHTYLSDRVIEIGKLVCA